MERISKVIKWLGAFLFIQSVLIQAEQSQLGKVNRYQSDSNRKELDYKLLARVLKYVLTKNDEKYDNPGSNIGRNKNSLPFNYQPVKYIPNEKNNIIHTETVPRIAEYSSLIPEIQTHESVFDSVVDSDVVKDKPVTSFNRNIIDDLRLLQSVTTNAQTEEYLTTTEHTVITASDDQQNTDLSQGSDQPETIVSNKIEDKHFSLLLKNLYSRGSCCNPTVNTDMTSISIEPCYQTRSDDVSSTQSYILNTENSLSEETLYSTPNTGLVILSYLSPTSQHINTKNEETAGDILEKKNTLNIEQHKSEIMSAFNKFFSQWDDVYSVLNKNKAYFGIE